MHATSSRLLAAVLLLAASGMPVLADSCAAPADQQTMNLCANEDYMASDKALNEAYAAIMARLGEDDDGKEALRASQRAWIAFRDAECAFAASGVEGGSIQPMIVTGCLQELTEERTGQLSAYLDCEEGDLSCPVPGE